MSDGWLELDPLRVYPILKNSPRFPHLAKHWGDEIDRTKSGVYFLIALDPKRDGDARRAIPRLFGVDPTGTLYIGKADRSPENEKGGLAARVGDLCKSILPGYSGTSHFNGKLRDLYADTLPADTLGISWVYLGDEHSYASELEYEFMQKYIRSFGEAPPFNSQGFMDPLAPRAD